MDKVEKINHQLYKKMRQEYSDLVDKIATLPMGDLISSAKEMFFKNDILKCLDNEALPCPEAEALLSLEHPLEELYNQWVNEGAYIDGLKICICSHAIKLVKEARVKEVER